MSRALFLAGLFAFGIPLAAQNDLPELSEELKAVQVDGLDTHGRSDTLQGPTRLSEANRLFSGKLLKGRAFSD